LLDRDTTQVQLTNAGAVFLKEARTIISHAEHAGKLARQAAQGLHGGPVVGNIGPLTANYMARCLTAYSARYPEVAVEFIDLDVPAQIVALEQRRIHSDFFRYRVSVHSLTICVT
jgi:DNA-binding transcriptional LysR family regulator